MKPVTKPATKPITKPANLANRLRINAGVWRSRVITFPDADGLRPTSDRVRETVFNWLGQTLAGKVCLDAFAGSGALGFEAASRNAARVVMCETNTLALKALRVNQQLLGAATCEIVAADILAWLKRAQMLHQPTKFDIVFCDPPFAAQLHAPFLALIANHLAEDGVIYVESGEPLERIVANPFQLVKSAKAGAVFYGLLRCKVTG